MLSLSDRNKNIWWYVYLPNRTKIVQEYFCPCDFLVNLFLAINFCINWQPIPNTQTHKNHERNEFIWPMAMVLYSKYWETQCSDSLNKSLDAPYSKSGSSWCFFILFAFIYRLCFYVCHIPVRDTLRKREISSSSEVLHPSFLLQNVLNCNHLSSSAFLVSVT